MKKNILLNCLLLLGNGKCLWDKTVLTKAYLLHRLIRTVVHSALREEISTLFLSRVFNLFFQGIEGNETVKLVITVLNDTKKIGNVETRIVEENESMNGKTIEISRNFFAFCKQSGSVFYFGEEVDMYKNGKIINHEGAWIAEGKNKSGLVMPGLALLGAKYYQEYAPDIAMDRAEILSTSESVATPAGLFFNCLKTKETNALKPNEKEYKIYAPGIGLIKDENLLLVKYGFTK